VLSEALLRAEEGYATAGGGWMTKGGATAVPKDWEACPNCGEKYGKMALPAHIERCRRLRPHLGVGKPGHIASGGETVEVRALRRATSMVEAQEEAADELRALFRRFDANSDGVLDRDELGALLRQCFPARCADAEGLYEEFQAADTNADGRIDFTEFVRYYNELKSADHRFDEAADMFKFFDKDNSGELDRDEFLQLLNNIFPERCDENEARLGDEFAAADADGGGGISFAEFCRYFDRLKALYDGYDREEMEAAQGRALAAQMLAAAAEKEKEAAVAAAAAERDAALREAAAAREAAARAEAEAAAMAEAAAAAAREREAAAAKALVACECGRTFLPDRLAAHERGCEVAQKRRRKSLGEGDAAAAAGANGFVPCELCGRKFFPDRLPVHLRVCRKAHAVGNLCRETVTPQEAGMMKGNQFMPTVGMYTEPSA
jgi:Ca2+-binding EF-hand superfamily protein